MAARLRKRLRKHKRETLKRRRLDEVGQYKQITETQRVEQAEYQGVCWNCCHKHWQYIGCPVKLKREDEVFGGKYRVRKIMETVGYFCSYQCALRWALDSIDDRIRKQSPTLIAFICYKDFKMKFDRRNRPIQPAPKRKNLILFGGHMSIEKYRNFHDALPVEKRTVVFHKVTQKYSLTKVSHRFGVQLL